MAAADAADRFRAAVAVYGILSDDNGRALLLRRAGSGYHDGELSLPAGHVDGGEDVLSALIRELREEITVEADRSSCRLVLVAHRSAEYPDDDEYIDLFFVVGDWAGTAAIGEPDRCSELVWAPRDSLPDDVIPYVADALRAAGNGERLLPIGWTI
jgi:8-oxo-dGTP diphosphatase